MPYDIDRVRITGSIGLDNVSALDFVVGKAHVVASVIQFQFLYDTDYIVYAFFFPAKIN